MNCPNSASPGERERQRLIFFFNLYSEFNTVFHIQFRGNFDSEKQTERFQGIARFVSKIHRGRGFLNSLQFTLRLKSLSLILTPTPLHQHMTHTHTHTTNQPNSHFPTYFFKLHLHSVWTTSTLWLSGLQRPSSAALFTCPSIASTRFLHTRPPQMALCRVFRDGLLMVLSN